ncbi:caspase family protein [Streptomyces sp. NPDC007205]|uniref:caspase, EACC1-associated type n=1 Tax=Streptomyces sp. NPDC007205 TaxID=3154316 RepID=UPI0033CF2777
MTQAEPPGASLATGLGSPGSRALLIGTGRHLPGSQLPDVPAVSATIRDLGRTLVDTCGLRPENLLPPLLDPKDPIEFGNAVVTAAKQAEDVLLLYYVGHGLVSPGNELYLATAATDDLAEGLAFKALPYQAVRDAFSNCRARSIIVVLDCCFAGRAHGSFGTAATDAFALASLSGSYVLASASRDEQALALPDEPYTAFTGELLRFLREGDPGGPPGLTIEGAYRHLRRVLPLRHLPAPERHLSGRAGDLVLAANPAAAPQHGQAATPAPHEQSDEQVCPYPGLDPFTADDARFFFGRAQVTSELLTKLADWSQDDGPVALVGLSGAGKSSLLRAGLLPAVKRGELPLPGAGTWPQLILAPGEHPLDSLAGQLARPTGRTKAELIAELRADPTRSAGLMRRALRRWSGGQDVPGGRLLLVVDQFEEVFTACQDEQEQRDFISAICSAATGDEAAAGAPALVVLGIRADFYASCLAHPELADVLKHRQFPVEPMTPEQLREAIEKPAEVAGLQLENGLANTLLRDLRADREFAGGALPLLAYALWLTWGRREGRTLTLAGYGATGGIWDAITQQADRTYDSLTPEARRAAKLMLLRMVRISESTEDTRRRLDLTDLLAQRPPDEAAAIAAARDALAGARLITVDGDSAQISHEALLRAWDRLRGWIDTSRAGLLVQQKLLDAAESWERDGRDPSGLYRGSQLELVRDQFGDTSRHGGHDGQLGELATEFFAASVRADRRRRRIRTGTAVTLILLLVASLIATGFAVQGRNEAQRQQRSAIAEALVRDADSARANNPRLALQLGIAADRLDHTPATTANLLSSLFTPYASTLSGHSGAVAGAAFAPGGRTLATASQDGTVILWDTSSPQRPHKLSRLQGPSYGVFTVAFSPDGSVLAAGGSDRAGLTVQMWDVSNPGRPRRLGEPLTGPANVHTLAFTPDGHTLAAGAPDGKVWLWDTSDPGQTHRLGQPLTVGDTDVSALAFRPDGHLLVAGGLNGTAVLWDVTDRAHPRRLKNPISHPDGVTALGFTPDGRTLVTGGGDGKANLWNTGDPDRPTWVSQMSVGDAPVKALEVFRHEIDVALADHYTTVWNTSRPTAPRMVNSSITGASNWTGAVAFAPHGDLLATGSADNTVILWQGKSDNGSVPLTARIGGIGAVQSMALRSDGHAAATGGVDGKVTLWDLADPKHPRGVTRKSVHHTGSVFGMAFSPDGHILASGSLDHTVILWDAADVHHLRKITQFTANNGGVDGLAFSPVGHTLATVGGDAAITLWDTSDPSRPRPIGQPIRGHRAGVDAVAFSPDGHTLATGSWDGTARLWNIDDLARPHPLGKPLAGHTNWVSSVAFSPDGHTLATGSLDSSIILWDITDPANAQHFGPPLIQHNSWVLGLDFGPDGHTLVSGSADQTAILWDVTDRVHPYDLGVVGGGHTDSVTSVAISTDNKTLLTASADGIVNLNSLEKLNNARTHARDLACARAGGGLAADQWARYVHELKRPRTC